MYRFDTLSIMLTLLVMTFVSASAPNHLVNANNQAEPKEYEDFNTSNFDAPTKITNQWFPLKPGMQYVYEGITNNDEGQQVPRRLVVTVTDLTKVIDGVKTVVSWDRDYNNGSLVEAELAFYAQDKYGNIWRMGEHPEEYSEGKYIDAPTWFAGIEDAAAGIEMPANPKPGQSSYSQGWAPQVNFTDRGKVSQMVRRLCVPAGCYEEVLVIDETSQAEPDAHQLKYYVSGVGNIRVGWTGEDETKERLELKEVNQLKAKELAKADAEALKEEKHAYQVSAVYKQTVPMK